MVLTTILLCVIVGSFIAGLIVSDDDRVYSICSFGAIMSVLAFIVIVTTNSKTPSEKQHNIKEYKLERKIVQYQGQIDTTYVLLPIEK